MDQHLDELMEVCGNVAGFSKLLQIKSIRSSCIQCISNPPCLKFPKLKSDTIYIELMMLNTFSPIY